MELGSKQSQSKTLYFMTY